MLKQKNSKIQANIGIGMAIAYFTIKGKIVCIPLTDSQDYDLIVDIEGLKKIQVKTTRHKNKAGNYAVELRTKTHSGKKEYSYRGLGNVDYIFVLTDEGKKYFIPKEKITSKTIIVLSSKFNSFLI